ncbi:hypothetical protein DVK44_22195 [Streptomyces paludis]|uniref:Uncharacterized protein n=1 Tax=Streptomyces paludis TaxID=2282738 RepID=A0A345I1J5_9ACTN|nr:hypothetical protein DVK44_22195 [Streptomyces paludis]
MLALAVLSVLASGCGIRTTSIPVDAGAAPSRMPCAIAGKNVITQTEPGVPVRIYLLCASGLSSVERAARIVKGTSPGNRVEIAQGLVDELLAEPSSAEREAGFTTSVRGPLVVSGARKGDPEGTLRISRQPEDLPTAALAQIVCTLAESESSESTDGRVVLGGPGDYPARGYECGPETKRTPYAEVPTVDPNVAAPSPVAPAASSAASPESP